MYETLLSSVTSNKWFKNSVEIDALKNLWKKLFRFKSGEEFFQSVIHGRVLCAWIFHSRMNTGLRGGTNCLADALPVWPTLPL